MSAPLRPGFRCDWHDGIDRILVYCETCSNWSIHCAPLGDSKDEITHRVAHCKLNQKHPDHCLGYFIAPAGEAPPALLTWLSDQRDWPKSPSDFGLPEASDGTS